MDEEKLQLVFEAINHASPVANQVKKDLVALNKELERVQKNLQGKGLEIPDKQVQAAMKSIEKSMQHYHRSSISLQKQRDREAEKSAREWLRAEEKKVKDAERALSQYLKTSVSLQKQRDREEAQAAREWIRREEQKVKEADRAQKQYFRTSISLQKQQDREAAQSARESERSRQMYIKSSVALQKQRIREEIADARRVTQLQIQEARRAEAARRAALAAEKRQRDLMHLSAMQAIRAEERAKQDSLTRRNAAFGAVSGVMGGISSGAGSVARVGNIGLGLAGNLAGMLGQATSIAGQVAGTVERLVVGAINKAVVASTALGGALLAVGGIVGKIGIEFNTFRENTKLTLEAMFRMTEGLVGAAKRADKVWDDAFNLSIPAKFTFDEIVEGFRTMEAFGLRTDAIFKDTTRSAGTLAVALAQGMEKPLAQVTRFLGNLKQGRYLLQQAAPLGLGREEMTKFGAEFDGRGAPVDRSKLLPAAMKAIESRWGDLIEMMEGTYESALDSMLSNTKVFFGQLTEGVFGGLTNAFRYVSDVVKNLFTSADPQVKGFVKALQMPFQLVGNLVQQAASQMPQLLEGLSKIVTVGNITEVFANVAATVQILGEEFGKFLNALGGGKGWDGFKNAAKGALDFTYRSWNGIVAGIEYVMKNSDKLWGVFVASAKVAMTAIEVMVGTVAMVIEAQLTGAITNVIGNTVDMFGNMLKNLPKVFSGKMPMSAGFGAAMGAGRVNLSSPLDRHTEMGRLQQTPGALMPDAQAQAFAGVQAKVNGDPFKSYSVNGIFRQSQAHGQFIIGQMGEALSQIGKQLPKEVTDFLGGTRGAIEAGAAREGIDDLMLRFGMARHQNRNRINELYNAQFQYGNGRRAPGAPGGDPNMAPGHFMGAMGMTATGQAPLPPSRPEEVVDALLDEQKERAKAFGMDDRAGFKMSLVPLLKEKITSQVAMVRALQSEASIGTKEDGSAKTDEDRQQDQQKILAARADYWKTYAEIAQIQRDYQKQIEDDQKAASEAQEEAIRAQIALLPESQRAAAYATQMVPKLREQQQQIIGKLRGVRQGTKEYWDLQTQGYRLQKEIVDMETAAADEKQKQAFDRPKRQFGTLKKLIGLLPKHAQGGAMRQLLLPRIQQTLAGANQETDPVERQSKLLEVVDMFTELKEADRASDPFNGMFGNAMAAQRSLSLRGRGRGGRAIRGRQQALFGAMSPFAPGMQGAGGGIGGDNFYQVILQIAPNASEEDIANIAGRAIQQQLQSLGN